MADLLFSKNHPGQLLETQPETQRMGLQDLQAADPPCASCPDITADIFWQQHCQPKLGPGAEALLENDRG